MSTLIPPDRTAEIREFVQGRTGLCTPAGPTQVMGFGDSDGELIGAWMFERYTGVTGSVHAHWASLPGRQWLSRGVLAMVGIYLFSQLRVDVVFGEVNSKDERMHSLSKRLGFEKTAVLPAYFPDSDLVVYSMTKHQCRWLPPEYKEPFHG